MRAEETALPASGSAAADDLRRRLRAALREVPAAARRRGVVLEVFAGVGHIAQAVHKRGSAAFTLELQDSEL